MITVQYVTTIKGVAVKAVVQVSGDPTGKLQLTVASTTAAGLDLFGILKAKVAKMIAEGLQSKGIPAVQKGSTVLAVLPEIEVQSG